MLCTVIVCEVNGEGNVVYSDVCEVQGEGNVVYSVCVRYRVREMLCAVYVCV
jgi:hypothetical protein